MVRVRIAPSPTGQDLHIGNAYIALLNYVFARKQNGKFIVRIEDTDRARFVPGSQERIFKSLLWLGLKPDESPQTGGPFAPYRQSERLHLYKKYAQQLIEKGHAYYCFCTPEILEKMRKDQQNRGQVPHYDGRCLTIKNPELRIKNGEKYVIRLKVPDQGSTEFIDVIRGKISFENNQIDDQVLLKSDAFPTYHLAVVVDDHLMQVSHVIRGEEWISSTPKHILLYRFFGWELPIFAHTPLLRNPDKSKLSKRKNPVWVSWYKEQGFLQEAIVNYLALMGCSHPSGQEIFSIRELIKEFTLERVQTVGPVFDIGKLRWINGEYIRKTQNSKLKTQIFEFYNKKYSLDVIEKIIPLIKERIKTLIEFWPMAGFFFEEPKEYEKPIDKTIVQSLSDTLQDVDWTRDAMEQAVRDLSIKLKQKPKDVFMQLRLAITGKTVGPPLLESMEILGRGESLRRLKSIF